MFDEFDDDDYVESAGDNDSAASSSLPAPRDNPELFGHERVERQILDLFAGGTLTHAMIFAGALGVGKTTMAFRLARFLLAQPTNPSPPLGGEGMGKGGLFGDDDPVFQQTSSTLTPSLSLKGEGGLFVPPDHPVFRKVASGGHPDLRFVERPLDEKKGLKKGVVDVDSVRTIAPFLRMKAAEGGWRVVIVDEADMMNRNAQNAILKILEEPPPKALLILICNRLGAMLSTIRSRCRTFHFGALDGATLAGLIKRAASQLPEAQARLIAELSEGSAGRALSLIEEGGVNTLNTILQFLETAPDYAWSRIHLMADTLSRPESERAYDGFASLCEWVAQGFAKGCAVGPGAMPEILRSDRLAPFYNHKTLEQWIAICEKLKEHFRSIDTGNLDRRQGVIGAFMIFGG
jgi:DNA polymerase-3 subunit delta'